MHTIEIGENVLAEIKRMAESNASDFSDIAFVLTTLERFQSLQGQYKSTALA